MSTTRNRPCPRAETTTTGFDRRSFLKASAGMLAAAIIGGALRVDAQAEQEAMRDAMQFFSHEEAETMAAIADRIWPPDADHPGASEMGVVFYIDRALAGPYSLYQDVYRRLLQQIDEQAAARYGSPAHELGGGQLDALLIELEELPASEDLLAQLTAPEFALGPQSSFAMLRSHVMEGVFSDPIYGGNREFAGWRTVNYPGAHYVYTAEEQQSFEPLSKPFLSVGDL